MNRLGEALSFEFMRSFTIKAIQITLLIFLFLYSLIWIASPSVSRYFLNDILAKQNLVLASSSSIRYNPFLSHISINDLRLSQTRDEDNVVLKIAELDLRLSLYQLLFERINITEFDVRGLYLKIDKLGEQLEVAGFVIPIESTNTTENDADSRELSQYTLALPTLNIGHSEIAFAIDQNQYDLRLKSLIASNILASVAAQSFSLKLAGEFNEAPLALDLDASLNNGLGRVSSDLRLSQFELAHLNTFLPGGQLSGQISYESRQTIDLADGEIAVDLEQLELASQNVSLTREETTISVEKQYAQGEDLSIKLVGNQVSNISGKAKLEITNGLVFVSSKEQVLMQFDSLGLDDIVLDTENDLVSVQIAETALHNVLFSDNTNDDVPALVNVSALKIIQLSASQQGLSIERVNLDSFDADVILAEDKSITTLAPLKQLTVIAEGSTDKQAQNASKPNFTIVVGGVNLLSESRIGFVDNSVSPVYQRNFVVSKLTTGLLNSALPETQTPFEFIGKSNKYAHFSLKGFVTPFDSIPVYHLAGSFSEVNLPTLSTYVKNALQYEFQSGQLDLGVDVTMTGEEIKGKTKLLLRGVELTAVDDHEISTLKDQTSIPFNIALGMLKDGDGNVTLDIPLSGNKNDPSFGLSGFITLLAKQAVMSAAKDYLVTTFVPYANVVSIAMVAGEYMLKVRFNDLVFPATETQLQPEHLTFLSQFSSLLKDKPDVQVTLCAVATGEDLGRAAGTVVTDQAEIMQLKQLSMDRMNAFKHYMIEKENINSARILLCAPQIDSSKSAKPRLTFST